MFLDVIFIFTVNVDDHFAAVIWEKEVNYWKLGLNPDEIKLITKVASYKRWWSHIF